MDREINYIKKIIFNIFRIYKIEIKKIILFGSRAKNKNRIDSDWDFLIIINKELDYGQKRKIKSNIRRKLAEKMIDIDIIIKSDNELAQNFNDTGVISYYALKEGITV